MPKIDPKNPMYSSDELYVYLGISKRTLTHWLREGRVPGAFQTPTGRWRIPESGAKKIMLELSWEESTIDIILQWLKDQG